MTKEVPEDLNKSEAGSKETQPEGKGAGERSLTEEQFLESLGEIVEKRKEDIARLENSITDTETKLSEAREKLNLPEPKEEPFSIFTNREALQRDKKALQHLEDERISRLQKKKGTVGDKFEQLSTRSMLLEEQKQKSKEARYKERGVYDLKVGDEVFYEGHIWRIANVIHREPHIEQISPESAEEIIINPPPMIELERGKERNIHQGVGDASWTERVTPETRARFEAMEGGEKRKETEEQ